MRRLWLGLAALGLAGVAVLALPAQSASAHPLGNFSVNQALALNLYPHRVEVAAVVDLAELPTLQERASVAAEGAATYNTRVCAALARDVTVRVDGRAAMWTVQPTGFAYRPGSAGLHTTRLTCALRAEADLSVPSTLDVTNRYRADRIGWRELTAAGHGVHAVDPPIPARSVTRELRSYPTDLLGSPLDQRTARLHVEPGDGPASSGPTSSVNRGDPVSRWIASADRALERLVGGRLTPLVGLLAVVLALALGAGHAALPGHGKTVVAAYLAGRNGRPRDALVVGATVTCTHTGGVIVLGLLLTTTAGLAGEAVLSWLGVASGVLVAAVGAAMLVTALRRRGRSHEYGHDHHHHDHGHHHSHDDPHPIGPRRRLGLLGMGIAGGLVPSPSALVVLLGAIGLGHTWFGVLLVAAYGVGMAGTLTAAGLLLIRLRDRWAARPHRTLPRIAALLPAGSAALVLCVGLGLAGRAVLALG
ncbi:MAG TPA: sulfite exporter TauE/SafE family protein [Jatrophihabitantaceae bacterium]